MTVAALSSAVQVRFGSDFLVQITNSTSTATTLNTTVLEAACSDAIGEFERITGMAHDTSLLSHVSVLVQGVLFFLELYKSRDSALIQTRSKAFYAACSSLFKMRYSSPSTNSNLTVTREQSGTKPDMDKNRLCWPGSSSTVGMSETINP